MRKLTGLLFALLFVLNTNAQLPDTFRGGSGNVIVVGTLKCDTIFNPGTGNNTVDDTLLVTGSVGIGTSSPTARLLLIGTGADNTTTTFSVQNSTESNNSMVIRDDGKISFGKAPDNGAFWDFKTNTTGGLAMRIQTNANTNLFSMSGQGILKFGALQDALLTQYRAATSGSPLTTTVQHHFSLNNSSNAETIYGRILGLIDDNTASSEDGQIQFRVTTAGNTNVEAARFGFGSIGIGGPTFDATGRGILAILNGTAPSSALTDGIQIYSDDSSDNTATLALELEQVVEVIGTFTPSHKLKININGVFYWMQLDAVIP